MAEAAARWGYFGELLGRPVSAAISEFLERGLLRPATLAERLEGALERPDLRALLETCGARKDSGKAARVAMLLGRFPAERLERLAEAPWLVLTDAGCVEVARYLQALDARRDAARDRVRAHVLARDVETAAIVAAAFHSSELFPPAIHLEWKGPVLAPEAERLAGAGRIDAAVAVLMCEPVAAADLDAYRAALAERSLGEMRRAHAAGACLAVRILPGRPCPMCGDVVRRFTWEDLEAGRVPRLPLHPGCSCSYCPEVLE